jgi:chromate transporter
MDAPLPTTSTPAASELGTAWEVFLVALGLGLTSFGGPIAHLGYFQRTYVERRRWLTVGDYAGLVALCQMAPGPASSQVGFLIGLKRAGWRGAFAAWVGFTTPSAILMFAFAYLAPRFSGPTMDAVLHGLKLVAVAVVAQAVWTMGRKLCPDWPRRAMAGLATAALLVIEGSMVQVAILILAGIAGAYVCRRADDLPAPPRLPINRRAGVAAMLLFLALLAITPLATRAAPGSLSAWAAVFYRTGALVFGGGHVVLPLLRAALVPTGWLGDNTFLSGYGAAQAIPGPLFSFASYLGAAVGPAREGLGGALLWSLTALIAIFLPGMLVVLAGVPLWNWLGRHAGARGALAGINAAVVGVLAAAFYNPVWTSAIRSPWDIAIAGVSLFILERRAPPVLVVLLCVAAALAAAMAGTHLAGSR